MFTGIIEEIGLVEQIVSLGDGRRIHICAPRSSQELQINDSVAINGVCLTVVKKQSEVIETVAVEETLKKTTLGGLSVGGSVNLELPMRLNERLGGHLVLGHVDSIGTVSNIERRETSWMFTVQIPHQYSRYVVQVGSIAIDGVSLTVAEIEGDLVRVSIIPHTMENTIFQHYAIHDTVNLEFDIVGKYIERLTIGEKIIVGKPFPTEQELRELGY
jgi:riboflavin synthase